MNLRKIYIGIIALIIFVLIIFNLKMIYTFDNCFFGTEVWDWKEYFKLVFSPTK